MSDKERESKLEAIASATIREVLDSHAITGDVGGILIKACKEIYGRAYRDGTHDGPARFSAAETGRVAATGVGRVTAVGVASRMTGGEAERLAFVLDAVQRARVAYREDAGGGPGLDFADALRLAEIAGLFR